MAKDIYGMDWELEVPRVLSLFPTKIQAEMEPYIKFKRNQSVRSRRIGKILANIRTFVERQKITEMAAVQEDHVRSFFEDLECLKRSEETKRDYAKILSGYFRWKLDLDPGVYPPQTRFLRAYRFRRLAKKGPAWSRQVVASIIDAGYDLRRKAMYTAEFYGGAFRIGENLPILDKYVQTVDKEKGEYRFYVDGKTGEGQPLVFDKYGYIAQWEAERRRHDIRPDGYFWAPLEHPYKIPSHRAELKAFKHACERAGVQGKHIFHWFRKSRMTDISAANGSGPMSSRYCRVSQQVMEKHYDMNNAQAADSTMRSIEYGSPDAMARALNGPQMTVSGIERSRLVDEVARQMAEKYADLIAQRLIYHQQMEKEIEQELCTSGPVAPNGSRPRKYNAPLELELTKKGKPKSPSESNPQEGSP